MELRHLRYFTAVAAHGNFSRAAEALHLTQPALSRQVKDLEDELGVPLFLRGKNAVTLTGAGESFYEEARDLLARADKAVQRVRRQTKMEALRVGYAPSLTAGVLPRVLERFQNEAPRVRVELSDLSPSEMWSLGKAGLLDLILGAADAESQMKDFSWVEARRLSPVLVLPKGHPLAKLKRIPPARLRDLPLIALNRASYPEYDKAIRRVLKPHGVTPYFAQAADGVSSMFAALEAHGSVSILTDGIASFLPATLVMRPFFPALEQTVVVAGMPAVRPNPHAVLFLRMFREEAARVEKAGGGAVA